MASIIFWKSLLWLDQSPKPWGLNPMTYQKWETDAQLIRPSRHKQATTMNAPIIWPHTHALRLGGLAMCLHSPQIDQVDPEAGPTTGRRCLRCGGRELGTRVCGFAIKSGCRNVAVPEDHTPTPTHPHTHTPTHTHSVRPNWWRRAVYM